jgi:hypothetical protein
VQSARAIHQAARRAIEARFFTDWCDRAPYTAFHPGFAGALRSFQVWPSAEQYDDLARQVPQPVDNAADAGAALPRFVAQDRAALRRLGGYEQHVAQLRAVPTRECCWHDFFNMAVWAHFPRLRWALNALHVNSALGAIDPRNGRAPAQNVAAQLDESGIIVASSAPELLAELRALRFKHVFWERRSELLATSRFWVVGHGMLESLLTPHRGLSAKALLLELPGAPASYDADELRQQVDARAADQISAWASGMPTLDPLPLLGIPGYANNTTPDFYDDASYFRFERRSPRRG